MRPVNIALDIVHFAARVRSMGVSGPQHCTIGRATVPFDRRNPRPDTNTSQIFSRNPGSKRSVSPCNARAIFVYEYAWSLGDPFHSQNNQVEATFGT